MVCIVCVYNINVEKKLFTITVRIGSSCALEMLQIATLKAIQCPNKMSEASSLDTKDFVRKSEAYGDG